MSGHTHLLGGGGSPSLSSSHQLPPGTNDDLETEGAHASPAPHPQPDPLVPGGTTLVPGTAPSLALARSLPLPTDALPTISPLDLFTTQIGTFSSEARVDAMRRLSVVAAAMGPDDALSTLLPYLATNVAMNEEEEDEVLLLLADQLGNLVPGLIPGSRALPVLPLLERIAGVEETVVREKAVESINKIVPCLSYQVGVGPAGDVVAGSGGAAGAGSAGAGASSAGGDESDAIMADADGEGSASAQQQQQPSHTQTPTLLLSMAKRLSGADWFTAKVSAAGVLPIIYRYFTDLRNAQAEAGLTGSDTTGGDDDVPGPRPADAHRELRALYRELSQDDAPMVRRSAARHLAAFVESCAALPRTAYELSTSPTAPNTASPPTITNEIRRVILDELVPIYQALGTDEQDSVRLLAVSASGSVGYALGVDPELTSELVFPVVRGGCQDLSW